jgi:hypothetical protein
MLPGVTRLTTRMIPWSIALPMKAVDGSTDLASAMTVQFEGLFIPASVEAFSDARRAGALHPEREIAPLELT